MKSHIVDLNVDEFIVETKEAYLFKINGKRVWLPKSQIEFDEEDRVVSMPERMAIDKELV